MLKLSNASICYAVLKCQEYPQYKVIIATDTRYKIEDIYNLCEEVINNTHIVKTIKKSNTGIWFNFLNGSSIHIISANNNARGYAAHLVIYDDCIPNDVVNILLRQFEKIRE